MGMKRIDPERFRKIVMLSLPVIGGMLSQNLLNLIDTAMVGRLGAAALAAVGVGGFAVFMSQSLVLGLSSGVQAIAARRVGEGREEQASVTLYAGIIVAVLTGGLLTAAIYPFVPFLFDWLNSSPQVSEPGSSYWRIRLLATVFMGICYAYRGYYNGIGQPKYYLRSLIIIHISNVLMNYAFIFGNLGAPALGVDGAAIASALATVIGALYYFIGSFYIGLPESPVKWRVCRKDIRNVLKLTIPSGLQQLTIATSLTSLFWLVGKLGVEQVAALNILVNILMFCILPGIGFGVTAATLVGTSLGEKQPDLARRWAYDVAYTGGVLALAGGLLLALFAMPILTIFTKDAGTLIFAGQALQITGLVIFLDVSSLILMNALLGAGDVKVVLKTSLFSQWLMFFPLALILVLWFEPSFLIIWLLFLFSRLVQGGVYWYTWQSNHWGRQAI